jgi:hypothetical protein
MINWTLIIILTIAIELATIFTRFVFKISSKETYIKIIKKLNLKFIIHIHHGILGIVVAILAYIYGFPIIYNIGWSMIISDAIHHFIVLYLIVGNPEFHIIYKNIKGFKKEQKIEDRKIKRFIRHLIHIID